MGLLAVLLGGAALTLITLVTGSNPWVAGLAPVGLVAGAALGARAVRRLGGVTGDVLGACVEATFTVALVAACLA
jgi:adenosylcobinamide-GDP ribazoletransferase